SELGSWILARQKLTNVAADARYALQAALVVEQVLDLLYRHVLDLQKIENHTRIEAPRPRSHHQAVEGGEAPARFDAPATGEGAHGAAATEMGDDDPAVGQCGIDLLQAPGDELVGDAMKTIAQ